MHSTVPLFGTRGGGCEAVIAHLSWAVREVAAAGPRELVSDRQAGASAALPVRGGLLIRRPPSDTEGLLARKVDSGILDGPEGDGWALVNCTRD
ncbi:hypothetical protein NDU88_009290 [Pleurodeles waltl]|uniref:Uncharacterized protein n=1 Tax=Pleurodeles waltl TaxID=8319 RepID=A0AAV7RY21_PLEWA|nr:hypothetical protein NDU88_009290 [Pleurodeles waltl]